MIRPAGFRIKTEKLRGQVSQGICFPPSILPPGAPTEEGADVTDVLGVAKYEEPPPVHLLGKVRGPFPGFLSKTDEVRVQVVAPFLERHRGKTFYPTEKLDGTSFTAFVRGDDYGICSRNNRLDETDPTSVPARVAREIALEAKLRALKAALGGDVAIQGELIGPGIQTNKYALRTHALRVYNLLDLGSGRLVDRDDALRLLAEHGLETVPSLPSLVLEHDVDALVQLAVGTSVLNPRVQREGLVFRPAREENDADFGGRLSFKVINPQFLLKYDE